MNYTTLITAQSLSGMGLLKLPKMPEYLNLILYLNQYAEIKDEYGAQNISPILTRVEEAIASAIEDIKNLPDDPDVLRREPNDLESIQQLRPAGPRRIWHSLDITKFRDRLEGAYLGRMAGCTLGAPVEGWPIEKMEALAKENGDNFPPLDYWSYVPDPYTKRYETSAREIYTRGKINGVPVDDDLMYTHLGLLVMEDYGPNFIIEDIGRAWLKYLPFAFVCEAIAIDNLRNQVTAIEAGGKNNPYTEGLGADIRCDPWGYMAPGLPEQAATFAYRDAYISHRRQGVYSAMFFAASIAAAFTVDDPIKALEIGLSEIPRDCKLAEAIRWALSAAPEITNYRQAREAVDMRYNHLHVCHAIPNACLTIFGVTIGGTDFTKVIGETVAMGWDNDCTAATAGSIIGAVVGKQGIPNHWHKNFNNKVYSYIKGIEYFSIDEVVERFLVQATNIHKQVGFD